METLYKELVDRVGIGKLTNTDEDPFWYTKNYIGQADARYRYHHETGKVGDIFYDGNNGDRWKVVAINTRYERAVVQNLSQDFIRLVFWEN